MTESDVLGLQLSLANPMEGVRSISRAALTQHRVVLMQAGGERDQARAQTLDLLHFQLDNAYDHATLLRNRLGAASTLAQLKAAMVNPKDRARVEQALGTTAAIAEADARRALAEVEAIPQGPLTPAITAHIDRLHGALEEIRGALSACAR